MEKSYSKILRRCNLKKYEINWNSLEISLEKELHNGLNQFSLGFSQRFKILILGEDVYVIPGTTKSKYLSENNNSLEITLSPEEI